MQDHSLKRSINFLIGAFWQVFYQPEHVPIDFKRGNLRLTFLAEAIGSTHPPVFKDYVNVAALSSHIPSAYIAKNAIFTLVVIMIGPVLLQ